MTDFTVNIEFSTADTAMTNAQGFRIGVAKGRDAPTDVSQLWVSAAIFEQNDIKWTNTYGFVAGPVPGAADALKAAESSVYPAKIGMTYPFVNNVFGPPIAGEAGQYAVMNQTKATVELAMVQGVEANKAVVAPKPVYSLRASPQMNTTFLPSEAVSILVYAIRESGVVNFDVSGPAMVLDLSGNPTQTIHYVGATNGFAAGPLPVG